MDSFFFICLSILRGEIIVLEKKSMMDIDARHSLLRDKLNNYGFTQPLPIGSIAIVSALLDDLILTNKNLKDAKKTIAELQRVSNVDHHENNFKTNGKILI